MTQKLTVKGPGRGYKLVKYVRIIMAHGGQFYVTDCHPWAIKEGCPRLDCPMRTLAIAPEATEDSALLECDPPGDLADTLISLRNTQPG